MTNLHLFGSRHRSCVSLTRDFKISSFDSIYRYSRIKHHSFSNPLDLASNFKQNDIFISFSPIQFSAEYIVDLLTNNNCHGIFVFLSSTSVFSKLSTNSLDSSSYTHFAKGEAIVSNLITRFPSSRFIIIRLSMLWGNQVDRNIHKLFSFCSSFGIIPINAAATGLRAPIHHTQLSYILYKLLNSVQNVPSGFYTLMGPEYISYYKICLSILDVSKFTMFKPFLLPIPNFLVSFLYALIKALRLSPFYSFISMFSRQPLDLVYHDNSLLEYINWDDSTDNFADLLHLTYS